MFNSHSHECFGTGTIGEKGQVVIPAKARSALNIKPGDEFIFFGHDKIIHMVKASELNEILNKISNNFMKNFSEVKRKIKISKLNTEK